MSAISNWYDHFTYLVNIGSIDNGTTYNIALLDGSYQFDSGDVSWIGSISSTEVSGTGYAPGGVPITVEIQPPVNGLSSVHIGDTTFPQLSLTFKSALIYIESNDIPVLHIEFDDDVVLNNEILEFLSPQPPPIAYLSSISTAISVCPPYLVKTIAIPITPPIIVTQPGRDTPDPFVESKVPKNRVPLNPKRRRGGLVSKYWEFEETLYCSVTDSQFGVVNDEFTSLSLNPYTSGIDGFGWNGYSTWETGSNSNNLIPSYLKSEDPILLSIKSSWSVSLWLQFFDSEYITPLPVGSKIVVLDHGLWCTDQYGDINLPGSSGYTIFLQVEQGNNITINFVLSDESHHVTIKTRSLPFSQILSSMIWNNIIISRDNNVWTVFLNSENIIQSIALSPQLPDQHQFVSTPQFIHIGSSPLVDYDSYFPLLWATFIDFTGVAPLPLEGEQLQNSASIDNFGIIDQTITQSLAQKIWNNGKSSSLLGILPPRRHGIITGDIDRFRQGIELGTTQSISESWRGNSGDPTGSTTQSLFGGWFSGGPLGCSFNEADRFIAEDVIGSPTTVPRPPEGTFGHSGHGFYDGVIEPLQLREIKRDSSHAIRGEIGSQLSLGGYIEEFYSDTIDSNILTSIYDAEFLAELLKLKTFNEIGGNELEEIESIVYEGLTF